jgi:eukaryotic-like serine/threonine-protein kinase
MSDQKPKRGQEGDIGGGLRAPAKGDSSSSEVPREDDGATFIEPPKKVPPKPRATPAPSDLTIDGSIPTRSAGEPKTSSKPRATPLPSDLTIDGSTPARSTGERKTPSKPRATPAPSDLTIDGSTPARSAGERKAPSNPRATPAPSERTMDGSTPARFAREPRLPSNPRATPAPSERTMDGSTPARISGEPSSYAGTYREVALQPGDLFGGRYEILAMLGEGGMGAVYKAADLEVDRTVALKVIRPELASNPAILARFKQELLTAHQVTHKNVIRIYDLAEAEGVKFITMEFVEGTDLSRVLLERGKLPSVEAVEIIRQVCLALDAAHTAGIIHRDLKPQNIMQDKSGRILVMDFGLARSVESGGMTQTGALLGTIAYMSPEQSMGKHLDQRSDLFAVGLIFYELLSGKTPFKAETAMASLLLRNQERAVPVREMDESIPPGLSDIVSKCLEKGLESRYQSAQEILHDLEAFQGARPTLASISLPIQVPVLPTKPALPWKWISVGTLGLAVLVGGWAIKSGVLHSGPSGGTGEAKGPEVSLAILPFQNSSNDAALDQWGANLADMLTTAVGQSAHLRIVSPDRLHQVLSDLRITPGTQVDPIMITNVAKFSNADTVVWGKYFKNGDKIHIQATMRDLKQGQDIPINLDAGSQNDISAPVNQLADLIRQNLSISSDAQKELKASSFQPTSKFPEALSAYLQGLQLRRQGKNLEAVKLFQTAVQADPEFALAYSRLAEVDSALGYDSQAEQASRKAIELSSPLPLAEKYWIEANHARVMKDYKKALQIYEKLAPNMPGDSEVQFTLGNLYLETGDYDKARTQFAKVLKTDPRNLMALLQSGRVEVLGGKPQAGLEPLNRALSLSIEVENDEQKALVLQAMGIAYDVLNKYDEALRNVQQSLEINTRLGNKSALANNYQEIGDVQTSMGKPQLGLAAYNEALKLRQEIGAKKDAANTLISIGGLYEDNGDYDKALALYKESLQTQRDMGDVGLQAACLHDIGNVYLAKGQNEDALAYYQQAFQLTQKLNDPAETARLLHDLGEAYTKTGQYDQAMSSFLSALDLRRSGSDAHNAALEQHSIGMVFLNQGRFGAAVSNLSDSVQGFRKAEDRSRIMVQVLIDYADALARAGRSGEIGRTLEEAQNLAVELKNDKLIADVHNSQGDIALYLGDNKTAKEQYQQALQLATHVKAPEAVLASRLNLARVAIAEGRSGSVINDLRTISQDADRQGMKYLALVSSVQLSSAMINNKDYLHAKAVLEQSLNTSEKLGTRLQTALIHYQMGNIFKQTADPSGSKDQYRQALTILDEIKKEQGAEHVLERADLKAVYNASTQGAQ